MYMELSNSRTQKTAVPHLDKLQEFQTVLKTYHMSDSAKKSLSDTRFAILIGPTSSGRNTLIRKLEATGRYHYIISDTTRPPRINDGVLEQSGVEYWFRTEDEFLADLRAGKFLEAEVIHQQQVSGVSIRELEKAHAEHKIAITDVDVGGVENIMRMKPDVVVILTLPPSFDVWQHRIANRGKMSTEEWQRRIDTALRIFSAPRKSDVFKIVINDTIEDAAKQVDAIMDTGKVDPALQARGLQVAEELYKATKPLLMFA